MRAAYRAIDRSASKIPESGRQKNREAQLRATARFGRPRGYSALANSGDAPLTSTLSPVMALVSWDVMMSPPARSRSELTNTLYSPPASCSSPTRSTGTACSQLDTIRYAAHSGMGALSFKFVDINASRAWVNAYYNTFVQDQQKLADYATNPNIAVVSGFMCCETDEEAWEKADGWTFFQFALQLYNKEGPFEPGTVSFWDRYVEWKKTPEGQKRSGSELIGSPDTIRARLKELEAANVDQVILLNQAGKNTHEDICASLELFAKEIMPEFHAGEAEHQRWKDAVLAGEIELEDIDTEPFNFRARLAPTKPSTRDSNANMVGGVVGRPASESV